ncbi:unnamed protein product [Lota lota]
MRSLAWNRQTTRQHHAIPSPIARAARALEPQRMKTRPYGRPICQLEPKEGCLSFDWLGGMGVDWRSQSAHQEMCCLAPGLQPLFERTGRARISARALVESQN